MIPVTHIPNTNYGINAAVKTLFSTGAQGTWYDPSDINLNWRYNLLTYTEQFDDAAWTKSNVTVIANTVVAPNGTLTADSVAETAINGTHLIFPTVSLQSGIFYTQKFRFKKGNGATAPNWIRIAFRAGAMSSAPWANFNLETGATGLKSAAITESSITALGDGWYECLATTTATTTSALGGGYIQFINNTDSSDVPASVFYLGVVTSNVYVWGASLTTAANASLPYQQIVTPEISYLNYQPQPILYQDSAGTTPVTAVEQPVGLMLDKSQGLVLGPQLVTNGTFATGTTSGFTATSGNVGGSSVINGELNVVSGSGGSGGFYQDITVVQGATYLVSVAARKISGAGSVRFQTFDGAAFTTVIRQFFDITTTGAATTYSAYIRTTSTTTIRVYLYADTSTTGGFDDVSIKLLPGNHAFQSTAASRPVLSARVNLIPTLSEDFTNSVYIKSNCSITSTGNSAPYGANGSLLTFTANGGNGISRSSLGGLGGTNTNLFRVPLKYGSWRWFEIATVRSSVATRSWIDLLNNVAGTTNHAGFAVTVIDGWAVVTFNISNGVDEIYITPRNANNNSSAASTNNGTTFYVAGWDFRASNVGVNLPAYQRVNTSTDYNTVGFLPYLKFDGVDDSFSTNSINFTSTNKMSVFAGVRKLSDAAIGIVVENGNPGSTNGTFSIANGYTGAVWNFDSRGTSSVNVYPLRVAPITDVITLNSNISLPILSARINGSNAGQNTNTQGTGNYGNYPLYIGRRGGTTLPLNGQLYSMIIVGKAVTASELSTTETYVDIKTGAY